jgi:hypothetical protein
VVPRGAEEIGEAPCFNHEDGTNTVNHVIGLSLASSPDRRTPPAAPE